MATMQAWTIAEHGGPEVFHRTEVERPEPAAGQAVVKVVASSVNPLDYKIREGRGKALAPPLPARLHGDVAGVITAVGPGVTEFKHGDWIYGCVGGVGQWQGALADYVLADTRFLAPVPAGVPLTHVGAAPLALITAWEGLDKANAGPGTRMLVMGGTGGVGAFVVQLAKLRGCHVTATAGDEERMAVARQLGADEVVNHRTEPVADYVQRLTHGAGFDVVFDTVGGENTHVAAQAARLNGTVVSIQARVTMDLNAFHMKGLSFHVVFMLIPLLHGIGMERHGNLLCEAAGLLETGRLRVLTDARTFTFDEAGAAHQHAEHGRPLGKVILRHPQHAPELGC